MVEPKLQFLNVGCGASERKIAYLQQQGRPPGLVWMPGLKSDMESTKASALQDWAQSEGAALLRFDYSGHGKSGGSFEQGTIGAWLEESEYVFTRLTQGPQVLIGSSMGGYLALLLLRRLWAAASSVTRRIAGLILIAPAWDMTEELMWRAFAPDIRRQIELEGQWLRASAYGAPYPITRCLIEDGRKHLLGRQRLVVDCPIVILHGTLDPDVLLSHSKDLMTFLEGEHLRLIEVEGGDHRLSKPHELAVLLRTVAEIRAVVEANG